jgi:hypothetical protein
MAGRGKVTPNPDQTFQAEFNELFFISIALKLNQNFVDSSPQILRKIHEMGWKTVSVGTEFSRGETQFSMPRPNDCGGDCLWRVQ